MSVRKFCWLLSEAKVGKRDKEWFPRWLRRYAQTVASVDGNLSVTKAEVTQFSRSLRDNGTPAWQRLQAVRAVEAYRNLVLKTEEPGLQEIKQKLGRIAAQEDSSGRSAVRNERQLIGRIDPAEPAHLQQMRKELRLRHKALETERAYVRWVRRFMGHCQSQDLEQFGETEIKSFLTHLAVEGNVSAGTQDQAKCALLFLYQVVLGRELAFLDVTPAKKPVRLPVVFSRQEIALLLPEFVGLKQLMFLTMYGAGLRHGECRRLRVKDLCFDETHIVVRNGKGDKDRITVLPERCREVPSEFFNRYRISGKNAKTRGRPPTVRNRSTTLPSVDNASVDSWTRSSRASYPCFAPYPSRE